MKKYSILLCCILLFGQIVFAQEDESLVLWLPLDVSASVQPDQSTNVNSCTVVDGEFIEGIDGGAFGFNDGTGRIQCEPSSSLANVFRGPYTLMWWSKVNEQSPYDIYFTKGNRFKARTTSLLQGNLQIATRYGGSNIDDTNVANFNGILKKGDWRHLAITSTGLSNTDGEQIALYHNGFSIVPANYQGYQTQDKSDELSPLLIAGNLRGAIDQVRLYNRVLTEDELISYANEFGVQPTPTPTPEPTVTPEPTTTTSTTTSTTTTTTTTTTIPEPTMKRSIVYYLLTYHGYEWQACENESMCASIYCPEDECQEPSMVHVTVSLSEANLLLRKYGVTFLKGVYQVKLDLVTHEQEMLQLNVISEPYIDLAAPRRSDTFRFPIISGEKSWNPR